MSNAFQSQENWKCEQAFLVYLDSIGLDPAVEVCPCDSGELQFVTGQAWDHIEGFLKKFPQFSRAEAKLVAGDIGEVSDFGRDEPEPDCEPEPGEPDEPDEPEDL